MNTWSKPEVTDTLEAENTRLREALRLITGQHMACGGNLRPEEALTACQQIAERTLAGSVTVEQIEDAVFEAHYGAAYKRGNFEEMARHLSGRLRKVDKRAKAANRRVEELQKQLRLTRIRAESAENSLRAQRGLPPLLHP